MTLKNYLFLVFLAVSLPVYSQVGKLASKNDYLQYFKDLEGKGCISGQFVRWNYNASLEEITTTHDVSQQWIGMLGADYYGNFQDSLPSPGCEYNLTNQVIDSYYKINGLVNLSVHFINPQSGGSAWDNEIDFDSVLISNSRMQNRLLLELDSVVDGLRELHDMGVTVIFRPFHEMNGGWFWWGKQERLAELWRFTYDYIVNKKNMRDLIWCWSPNAGTGNMDQYYPGDKYVDIVGLDAYTSNLPELATDDYQEILKYNKPFGFSEYGCISGSSTGGGENFDYGTFLEWMKEDFPEAVYFLVWRDHWGFNGRMGVQKLLDDPWIVNREEVMELRRR